MWVLTTFFALTSLVIAWLCAAYFVVLRFVSILRKRPIASIPENLPTMSVIVPCYNEAETIAEKLLNLLACDYPTHKLEIVFVDGGSTDGTIDRLMESMPDDRRIRIAQSPCKGKTNQLNYVLPTLRGDYIVNTDADARLREDTLKQLAAEFELDRRVAVVGAFSHAPASIWRDRCFWDSQNRSRLIESDAFSSSIVIATCYAFRRGLLAEFPEDVVADDVYVGFLANAKGHRVVYSRLAIAEELRGPSGISEFLSHKFRKNNAFLRETLRFIYCLPDMNGFCKLMTLTRIAQQLLLPWAVGLWSVLALTLLTLGRVDFLAVAAASIGLLIMFTSQAFHSVDVPAGTSARFSILKQGSVFVQTIMVLCAAALSYPFFRQNSSFSRLGSPAAPNEAPPVLDFAARSSRTLRGLRATPAEPDLIEAIREAESSPQRDRLRGLEPITAD